MTVGKDVSALFPDVVNCMQTDNLELKKLVYLYLMNYAKTQPDMAIMAVNTFVKVCVFFSNFLTPSTFFLCVFSLQGITLVTTCQGKPFFCVNNCHRHCFLNNNNCYKKTKQPSTTTIVLFVVLLCVSFVLWPGLRRSKSVDKGAGCAHDGLHSCR